MTHYSFNNLSIKEKLAYTGNKGLFLDCEIFNGIVINYYVIDKLFIEIVYDTKCQSIIEVKSFKPMLIQKNKFSLIAS